MKEQKTVLSTQVNGETAIVMPITKLECIEDTATSVDSANDTDYIPVIDSADEGQMKKITVGNLLSGVKSIADTAKSTADTAKTTATEAKTAATNAQSTANTAKSTADTAKSTADTAKTTATEAKTAATNAQAAANEAKTAAESAQSNATKVEKSTTNGNIKIDNAETTVYTHPSYTARTGVPTANQTPAFGGTFAVTQPVSDATGHITAMNSRSIKIPSTPASASAAGLITTGAQTLAGDKTFNGKIIPNGASDVATAQARKISAGTDDLTAGASALETGTIYLVYE